MIDNRKMEDTLTPEQYDQLRRAFDEDYQHPEGEMQQEDVSGGHTMIISACGKGREDLNTAVAHAAEIIRTSEEFKEALDCAAKVVRQYTGVIAEVLDKPISAINEAWEHFGASTWDDLEKIAEECARLPDPEPDRHDGAVVILTIWLPPTPDLQKLYGQGIDYGGPARPVRR